MAFFKGCLASKEKNAPQGKRPVAMPKNKQKEVKKDDDDDIEL